MVVTSPSARLQRARERLRELTLGAASVAGHMWRRVARYATRGTAGLVLLSYGASEVYGPAGWIVAGGFLLADSVVDDLRAARAAERAARPRGGDVL